MCRRISQTILKVCLLLGLAACARPTQTVTEAPASSPSPTPAAIPEATESGAFSYPYPPVPIGPAPVSTTTLPAGSFYPYPPALLGPAPIATQTSSTAIASPSPPTPAPPRPTPLPTRRPIISRPVTTSFGIIFISWSPAGRYLSFLTQTLEEAASIPADEDALGPLPGTVHFHDTETENTCQYPRNNPLGLDFYRWFAWLPDSRLLVLSEAGDLVEIEGPCTNRSPQVLLDLVEPVTDVLTSSADGRYHLLQGESGCWLFDVNAAAPLPLERCSLESSFSPSGDRLVAHLKNAEGYITTIINTSTGRTVRSISWSLTGGPDPSAGRPLPGPYWLDNRRFLIYPTDAGPLLATLGASFQVQRVAETLFGITGSSSQTVEAAISPDGSSFHLLLKEVTGPDARSARIFLYHSENNQVERIQYAGATFSPGGQFLDLWRAVEQGDLEETEHWLRPVDPPESESVRFSLTEDQDSPALSVEGLAAVARIAEPGSLTTLLVKDAASGEVLWNWFADPNIYNFYWSPAGDRFAAIGTALLGGEQALFLFTTKGNNQADSSQ